MITEEHVVLRVVECDSCCGATSFAELCDGCYGKVLSAIRATLKRSVIGEVGELCEACNVKVGTDLHEVYVKRSAVPKRKQDEIFVRTNCALICRQCHDGPALTEWFKDRFEQRLYALGYDGRYKFPRGNI